MLHRTPMLIVALGLVCASGASASAADLCIELEGGGAVSVIKNPRLQLKCCPADPAEANTCEPVAGFEQHGFQPQQGGIGGAITGSICVDKESGGFTYHYMYHNAWALQGWFQGYFETAFCRFGLTASALTKEDAFRGTCRGTVVASPAQGQATAGTFRRSALLWHCDVPVTGALAPN
jgi:hypothetical protein